MHIWASHPVVHPDPAPVEVEAPPPAPAPAPAAAPAQGANAPIKELLMMGYTPDQFVLRLWQVCFAAAAVGFAHDFPSVTAFRYLVSAAALQCLWSLAVAIVDVYALLVGRSFQTLRAIAIFCIGDWVTGALTFNAACASAGTTILIDNHPEFCHGNSCPNFMTATGMAFFSWFLLTPYCVQNLAALVYKLQRP